MRIVSMNLEPICEIPFLNAGSGPGDFYVDRLPIHEAVVDRLPEGIGALIATADLQGRERFEDRASPDLPPKLLGEVLPARLANEILPRFGVPPREVGVLLAGDFYTVPALDRRGGSGDVTAVWEAFADRFAWVVGVAGNHDTFGESLLPPRYLANLQRVRYLDGNIANVGKTKIGGLGGIIGNPRKPHRRTDDDYLRVLQSLLDRRPDVLLMHDGPNAPVEGLRGSSLVRQAIERAHPTFVVRGHAHWNQPLVELPGGAQVLNVDARVVVLRE